MLEANNEYFIFTRQEAEIIFNEKLMNLPSMAKEPSTLFYEGTKILSQKLIYLNELKNDVSNLKLDYNLFIEKASPTHLTSKSILFFAVAGFVLGLFISLIIIFIRA